jgi:DNA-binding FrmR family transcriptional regulator
MNTNKTKMIRRLQILEGQVRGIKEMIEKDTYCVDVITQTSAIKQGLSGIEDMLMEYHLSHCVVKQIQKGTPEKAVEEVLKVYKLKRK